MACPTGAPAPARDGVFDRAALAKQAREWPGLVGMDLVPMVTSGQRFTWDETPWKWGAGYGRQEKPEFHVVAIDYGIKRNILRLLAGAGCRVTVVPAQTSADDIIARPPGGRGSRVPGVAAPTPGRHHPRPRARRRLSLQRPRRSGRHRHLCGAG